MITLKRFLAASATLYVLLLAMLEWLSLVDTGKPLVRVNNEAEPIIAVVFYTDEPEARGMRIDAAIKHFKNGEANFLVMAGGDRPQRAGGYNGAKNMRLEAIARGVPDDKVVTDLGSNDTVSNLLSAMESIKSRFDQPFKLALVTDSLQLLRLSFILRITDFKMPLLQRPVLYFPSGDSPTGFDRLMRLNHELLAYFSMLLPQQITHAILAQTRRN
jgi:vancomycin permeability regulator SanA